MKCFKGIVQFPEICYTEPGIYNYTIQEITPSNKCWKTDSCVYHVRVTVEKDSNGRLATNVKYLNGFPTFINRYCPPKCSFKCR